MQPLFEATRAISSPLNRLAAGFLCLYLLASSGEISAFNGILPAVVSVAEPGSFSKLVVAFIFSLLIGTFVVAIGREMISRKHTESYLLQLALRVERNGSQSLMGLYRDGLNRLELAGGLIGAFAVSFAAVIWNRLFSGTYLSDDPSEAAQLPTFSEMLFAFILIAIIRYSALSSLRLVDEVASKADIEGAKPK